MTTEIISTYIPAIQDVSDEQLLSTRQRLSSILAAAYPDLDTRPNSTFGDLHLSPLAALVAAIEVGMQRFMSDLDLENVSNGIIWNCPFVTQYLKNFAVYNRDTLQSSGVVRLTFNEDNTYFLDRSTKIGFGPDVFDLRMPHSGGWFLRAVGLPLSSGVNNVNLVDAGDGTYYADVPVIGAMTEQVEASDSATISPVPEELIAVEAVLDFGFGTPPESLSKLAEKTRQTIYSASMGARGPARRFLEKEFPDITASSPVLSGDSVMLRDSVNALGIADGRMDVYLKSPWRTDTQVVTAVYDDVSDKFVTKLEVSGQLMMVDDVKYNADDSVPNSNYQLISRSKDGVKAKLCTAAYSNREEVFLVVDMIRDEDGNEVISTDHDVDGNKIATLSVTFRQDPMVPVVSSTLESADVSPVGVDVLTKGFVPVVIQSFNVRYSRRPGVTMTLDKARDEIFQYIQGLGHPYTYSDAKIIDSMFYAGASEVVGIDVVAKVKWTVGNKVLPSDSSDPITNLSTALTEVLTPPAITIPNSAGLKPDFVDPYVGLSNETLAAIGKRNICYVLDIDTIEFTEVEEG